MAPLFEHDPAPATVPGQAAELIDYLRSSGMTLTYDPCKREVRTEADAQ